MMRITIVCLSLLSFGVASPAAGQAREEPVITASSEDFANSTDEALSALASAGFDEGLQTPTFGSMSSDRLDALVQQVRREDPLPNISRGQSDVTYDVILQPGHYGRTTGRVGTSGELVSERALVAYIVRQTADELRRRQLNVLVISADQYQRDNHSTPEFEGLRATAFLAVHADGSERPCTTGPSLAYKSNSSLLAMHAIGYGLAAALGYEYEAFRRDNFTANSAQYYMFDRVRAATLTGLLEIGELTCPTTERALLNAADQVAVNVARALDFIVSTAGDAE